MMFSYLKLKNFKSLGNIELNLKKNKTTAKKIALIYGENGSGKSNIVSAFSFLKDTMQTLNIQDQIAGINEVLESKELKAKSEEEKMEFKDFLFQRLRIRNLNDIISEVKMIDSKDEMVIEYGFIIHGVEGFYRIKADSSLLEEELYYLVNKKSGLIFKISEGNKYLNKNVFKDEQYRSELELQIDKYWGKHTFLSILQNEVETKNIKFVDERITNGLMAPLKLFMVSSVICKNGNGNQVSYIGISNKVLGNVQEGKINSSNLSDLKELEELLRDFFSSLYSDVKDVYYKIDDTNNPSIKSYKLFFKKLINEKIRDIDFSIESTGTQKILEIFPALFESMKGSVAMIDEMDSGIHDLLVNEIFENMYDQIKGQLIITTHNTLLMESAPNEDVYIIKISSDGTKSINCITDYEQRTQKNHNLRERYLKGNYEGIPETSYIDFESWGDYFKKNSSKVNLIEK